MLPAPPMPPRLTERVGLAGFATAQRDVGSPFDYRHHALLYVARHLPDRRGTRGRGRPPRGAGAAHRGRRGAHPCPLHQPAGHRGGGCGPGARPALHPAPAGRPAQGAAAEEFTEDESSCLFATLGFWQGVDVPGRALSLVTLDRLPFPRPDDPLVQARRDRPGAAPSPWSTSPAPPPCSPRGRDASSARPRTGAWWRSSTLAWPPPATAGSCWPPSRPCAARSSGARSKTSSGWR